MPPAAWLSAPSAPPTVTLLLRHGQTQMTVEKRYAGTSDAPLNEAGLEQATAAAKRLATAGLDAIVSSPLRRARATASEAAALCGLPVAVDEGFRETDFGEWEGLTFTEVREGWPDVLTAWLADPEAGPPGGESFAAAAIRIDAAMERVLAVYAGQKVLIVSHVGPIKALVASALQAPPSAIFRMHLDIAALSSIDWHADGRAVLRSYNDTAHLRQP